jgi:serine/threonine protein kinase
MLRCLTDEEVLACASRQGEVGDLLAHIDECAKCRTLVACTVENSNGAVSVTPTAGSPGASTIGYRETTISIGSIVAGRYEIRRFLGRGGMGEVYEANDTELGDLVALKTLAMTALDDTKAVTRMKAEVLLARRVAHPNVCRIFDFGVHESRRPHREVDRLPFLTMELLAGQTLRQRLRQQGPMASTEAMPIVEQIVAGLGEVHRVGIIHRDLKSENVFLARSALGERAVLMDFGLARTAPLPDLASDSLTHHLVGTVMYMSPEQVQNKPLGPPSDIYALGLVMYEMVTGKLPFTGTTPFELAFARLRQLPASPSIINPAVTRAWARTIMKCLSIAPQDRFERAADVLDALTSRHHGHPTRRRLTLGASAAALVLGVAAFWPHRAPQPHAKDASLTTTVPPTTRTAIPHLADVPALPATTVVDGHSVAPPVSRTSGHMLHRSSNQFMALQSEPRRGRTPKRAPGPVADPGALAIPRSEMRPGHAAADAAPTPNPSDTKQSKAAGSGATKDSTDRIFNPFAPSETSQ